MTKIIPSIILLFTLTYYNTTAAQEIRSSGELNLYQIGASALKIHQSIYLTIWTTLKNEQLSINKRTKKDAFEMISQEEIYFIETNMDEPYIGYDTVVTMPCDTLKIGFYIADNLFIMSTNDFKNDENNIEFKYEEVLKILNGNQLYYLTNFNQKGNLKLSQIPVNSFNYLRTINTKLYKESIKTTTELYEDIYLKVPIDSITKKTKGYSVFEQTSVIENKSKSLKVKHHNIITGPLDNFNDTGLYQSLVFVLEAEKTDISACAISAGNTQHNTTIMLNTFNPFGYISFTEIQSLESEDIQFIREMINWMILDKIGYNEMEADYITIYGLNKKTY